MDKHLVIIPNTISPYGYETIPVLAFPEGFQYRFRFDEEWVQDSIVHRQDLNGKEGYIVLREFKSGQLYPIRHFKIITFKKIGTIFYIEIQLGQLVAFDSDASHRQTQVNSFNDEFTKFNSGVIKSNPPGNNMSPLVFLTNFPCKIQNEHKSSDLDEEMESWGNILSCFKDVDFFTDVQFLRIISAEPLDSKNGSAAFINGELVLKEGADYKIQLAQFITKISSQPLAQTDIKIIGDNLTISVLRGVQRAVGKYDILTFVVRVNKDRISGATFLDVQHSPTPALSGIGDPHMYIPIKITKSPRKYFHKAGVLLFFILLYAGPSFTSILPSYWLTSYTDFIKDISIIGFTISLLSLAKELGRA